jgi:hypothetical protein
MQAGGQAERQAGRKAGRQAGRQAGRLIIKLYNSYAGIVQGRQERERCRLRCRGERERSTEDAICQVPTLENVTSSLPTAGHK